MTLLEQQRRDRVIERILQCIRTGETIKLPPFDPALSIPSPTALATIGAEPNDFSGTIGDFRYQFEGEEDLLHIIVTRLDGSRLTAEEGQVVVGQLVPSVSPAVIWLRPGEFSQHFYFGHDELLF